MKTTVLHSTQTIQHDLKKSLFQYLYHLTNLTTTIRRGDVITTKGLVIYVQHRLTGMHNVAVAVTSVT